MAPRAKMRVALPTAIAAKSLSHPARIYRVSPAPPMISGMPHHNSADACRSRSQRKTKADPRMVSSAHPDASKVKLSSCKSRLQGDGQAYRQGFNESERRCAPRLGGVRHMLEFRCGRAALRERRLSGLSRRHSLAHRQAQRLKQLAVLLSGTQMRHRGQAAEQFFVQRVEYGQAHREQRAENHALGDDFGDTRAQPHRDLFYRRLHEAHRAGGEHRDAVAHEDPIDGAAVDGESLGARPLHQARVVAHLARVTSDRIDMRHNIEIDETVVEWSDERIRKRMREARKMGVEPGRVDDEEIGDALDLHHRLAEEIELELMIFLD